MLIVSIGQVLNDYKHYLTIAHEKNFLVFQCEKNENETTYQSLILSDEHQECLRELLNKIHDTKEKEKDESTA